MAKVLAIAILKSMHSYIFNKIKRLFTQEYHNLSGPNHFSLIWDSQLPLGKATITLIFQCKYHVIFMLLWKEK